MNTPVWISPLVQSVHLLGLALLFGVELCLALRIFGGGLTKMPLTGLAIELRFWFRLALTVSALTGALMVGMNAPDIFAKDAFWVKIAAVVLALILVLGFRDRAVARGGSPKILTAAILFLWLLAASAGRWIGFS